MTTFEYRGLRIGTVLQVPMRLPTPEEEGFASKVVPVLVHIEMGQTKPEEYGEFAQRLPSSE